MNKKPYQTIIKNKEGTVSEDIIGSFYLKVQSNPNIKDFCFCVNGNEQNLLYLDKNGIYEINLADIAFINKITFFNTNKNQIIIIDTIREKIIERGQK